MRRYFVFLFPALFCGELKAQVFPVEGMVGQRYLWYQQQISISAKQSPLGFFHVSSFQRHFSKEFNTEWMSQSYLTLRLSSHIKLGAGTHYLGAAGLYPSVHLQLSHAGKKYLLLAVPRSHLTCQPAYDVMLLAEYKPLAEQQIKPYARYQALFSYQKGALKRSYQHLRLGLARASVKLGLAFNLDTYPGINGTFFNAGLFFRKDILP